ncbi:hypothetical protein BGX28_002462 [Mortierella sp. GBA30]|nr:hypothetical protein BGX28_002462 [Mortierella sp. GBA30]
MVAGKSYNTVVATELMASIPKEADANGLLTVPEPASKDMAVVATASVQDALHVEMLPTPTSSYGNIQVERNQQENYGHRAQKTNLLASLNLNLAARPLVTAKEPTVMFNLLTLLKEQRQSRNGVGCTDNDINDTNCKREARPACATPNHTENACRDLDNPNQNRYHPKDSDNEYINNIEKNNHNDNSNENYRQPTAPATSNRVGISFQDKKQFLEIQEMRRNNARQRSQSATGLTTIHKGDGSPPSAFPLLRPTTAHVFVANTSDARLPGSSSPADPNDEKKGHGSTVIIVIIIVTIVVVVIIIVLILVIIIIIITINVIIVIIIIIVLIIIISSSTKNAHARRIFDNIMCAMSAPGTASSTAPDPINSSLVSSSSWQHDSGGDIEKPSIQHSSPAAVRRAGNKSVNLSGESEEEDLCYFTIPVRTRSRSPSPSPYPIQDRLPSISERQEQAQEKSNGAGDFSVLNSRFANLKLMDSLCPIQPCPLQAGQGQEHGNARMMDPMWAVQITQLLNYLADKADIEEEEQGSSFGQAPFARPCLRVGAAGIRTSQSIETDIGLYKQILHDWVLRLDQVPRAVYEGHSGLKREIDKIRWQHNIVSSSPSTLTTTVAGKGSLKL